MKIKLFSIVISLVLPSMLLPNGAPFKTNYVFKTFNPQPIDAPDIKIIKENLGIVIHEDYSTVTVEYTMKNSGNDLVMDYGFPVDYFMKTNNLRYGFEKFWNPANISEFSISDENGKLDILEKFDTILYDSKLKFRLVFYDKIDIARKWFFVKLKFRSNLEKIIKVRYTISNTLLDMLMSDKYFILYSDRLFTYDFSPAAYIGNSNISELNIRIDATELESCNCFYNTNFRYGFENINGLLSLQLKNVNPIELKELTIQYKMDNVYKTKAEDNFRFGEKWFGSVMPAQKEENNKISNIFDGKPATGLFLKSGLGSKFEIHFGKDSVSYIGFINGCVADRESFLNYPRIKKLKLEIFSKTFRRNTGEKYLILELKDNDFSFFNKKYYGGFITTLFDLGQDFYDDIRKIRITILDVYPGKIYNTPCIGELFVFKYRYFKPPKESIPE